MKTLITIVLIFQTLNCNAQSLTDTLVVDIDGKGSMEKIYFENDECRSIRIVGGDLGTPIVIGCGNRLAHLSDFNWVEFWKVIKKKETYEVYFKENGDIDDTRPIMMQCDGIYIGEKDPTGGGIITFINGELTWIHQAD